MIDSFKPEPSQIIQDLSSPVHDVKLSALRNLKNSIIGNRKKKLLYMDVMPIVVQIMSQETDEHLLIQAAATLGSFGKSDMPVCTQSLIRNGSIPSLLKHITSKNLKLVESCIRSLKIIYETRIAPTDLIFSRSDVIHSLIMLLTPNANDSVNEVTASLLARCCQNESHQNAIAHAGGIHILSNLLYSSYPKSQEAALDAVSSLCQNNVVIGEIIMRQENLVTQILNLVKDRRPRIRLLSVKCLANLNRSGVLKDRVNVNDITVSVLPVIVKLLNDHGTIKEDAPSVLANLVTGNEELQKAACDASAIAKLAAFLQDESASDLMKENVLNALAELSLNREEGRKLVLESKILPDIISATGNQSDRIRKAAIYCIKGLSRSSKQLRALLIEAGVANHLFALLKDTSTDIQAQACAVISNIVLDFAPMKQYLVEKNGIEQLVSFTQSMDCILRLNSVFALKNLAYFADGTLKAIIMKNLQSAGIFRLLNDDELEVQETAMNLLRNLIHGDTESIQELIVGKNGTDLLEILVRRFRNTHDDGLLIESLFVLCNLAACYTETQKLTLLTDEILGFVLSFMKHQNKEVRSTAVWTLINLTWKDDAEYENRVEILQRHGCVEKLEELLNDPDVDVRDRSKQCLEQIQGKSKQSNSIPTTATTFQWNDEDDDNEEDEDIEMGNRDDNPSFLSMHDL